jgi:uncharacterized protein (TIGR03067 family)
MRNSSLIAAICAVITCIGAAQGESPTLQSNVRGPARDDLAKMQGTWKRVSMELQGKPRMPDEIKDWTSTYRDDELTLYGGKEVYRRGIVTLDASQTPKAMNTWDSDGPFKDQTVPGIYELDGDTMRVCFALPGHPRPTEFTTKHGSGFLYCEFKRVPPAPAPITSASASECCPRTCTPCRVRCR